MPIVVEARDVQVSSDAGILPLRQFDDPIGFTQRFIACLNDPRAPERIDHGVDEMVRQRFYGLLAGYEDCNDHDTLRGDPVFKLVSGRTPDQPGLASQPTLSRFENAVDIDSLWEYVVTRFRKAWPDVWIHGRGDAGCGVPWMYAVCERLQVEVEDPPWRDPPWRVEYTLGLAANSVLKHASDLLVEQAVQEFEQARHPQRLFDQFLYRAASWKNHRRVIVKAEANALGTNRRFIVTSREEAAVLPEAAYDAYAERGESENRNKEIKRGVMADRLSCHRFMANYFRLHLHTAALNLAVRLRRVVAAPPTLTALGDPDASRVPVADPNLPVAALVGEERRRYHNRRRQQDPLGEGHLYTWRLMVIKVAGEVIQSTRRILVRLPVHWPHLNWFRHVCDCIARLGGHAQAVL